MESIGESYGKGQPPEAAAILVVVLFVTRHIEQSFSAERRKAVVGEFMQILGTSFEDVQDLKFDPFVDRLVAAWQVAQDWIAGARIDKAMANVLMSKIIGALQP